MALTGKNEIVGTLFYMSPEQLQSQGDGQAIDGRSDIFSFGLVLYEILTGKRAIEGASPATVIAAIMERPAPSIADVAPVLDRVLRKCLAKDPDQRWQTARDLKDELEWIAKAPEPVSAASGSQVAAAPAKKEGHGWLWPATSGVLLLALTGLAGYVLFRSKPAVAGETLRFQIPASEKSSFNIYLSLSPDGRKLAYVANGADGQSHLWIRSMDSLESRSLPGTESAASPFWSPDSRFIAFGAASKLKRIDVSGGPVQTVCDLPVPVGMGFWGLDGFMIVGNRGAGPGLWRVSASGGKASLITKVNVAGQERAHGFPVLLPDGKHFLYTRLSSIAENAGIFLGTLDAQADAQGSKRILPVQSSSVYVPPSDSGPGYLLFLQGSTLLAQPFDARNFELGSDPIALAEQVGTLGSYGFFSASTNGTLAYRLSGVDANNQQLRWYDRQGKALGVVGAPVEADHPAISPDGSAVVMARFDRQAGISDVWVHDLSRNTDSRLTHDPQGSSSPVWSPDGSKIAFSSSRDGTINVYQKNSSGVGQDEALDTDQRPKAVRDWSHDGQYLIEEVGRSPKTGLAVWVLPLFGERKPFPYLESEFDESYPKLSPNGQWLAYQSNETKRNEIYVQSFPKPGGKWKVSTDGGTRPIWSRDGKELFFLGTNEKLMAVEVRSSAGNKFDNGLAKPLFDLPNGAFTFDVSKDGRFLIPGSVEQTAGAPITVVVNWAAGQKRN
jgi:Tol biopolymer transport system component